MMRRLYGSEGAKTTVGLGCSDQAESRSSGGPPVCQNVSDEPFTYPQHPPQPHLDRTGGQTYTRGHGQVAEWLRSGLQSRVHEFDSRPGLHRHPCDMTERNPDSFIWRYRWILLLVVFAATAAAAWFSGPS
jgi:hypothetical protein